MLAAAPVVRDAGLPLAPMLGLDHLVARLDRELTPASLEMLEAHAQATRLQPQPSLRGGRRQTAAAAPPTLVLARKARTEAARRVLAAWRTFDAAIDRIPGLAGQSAVLSIFRLNDATYTRAAWFVERPQASELAPLLADVALELKPKLAPPRLGWERRFGGLIARELHAVAELQEADRFIEIEKQSRDFEQAYVAQLVADAGSERNAQRLKAALSAAELGLYVREPGHRARISLAATLAARTTAMDEAAKGALAEAMQSRGVRTL